METLPPLVRLGMCRAGAGVAGRGERWIPDGEMASAKWHAGACGAILIAWSALFPAGSVIGSSRRTLRQWCSGGVGLVLQAWHCGRSCGAGTHLRYPVAMFPQVTPHLKLRPAGYQHLVVHHLTQRSGCASPDDVASSDRKIAPAEKHKRLRTWNCVRIFYTCQKTKKQLISPTPSSMPCVR